MATFIDFWSRTDFWNRRAYFKNLSGSTILIWNTLTVLTSKATERPLDEHGFQRGFLCQMSCKQNHRTNGLFSNSKGGPHSCDQETRVSRSAFVQNWSATSHAISNTFWSAAAQASAEGWIRFLKNTWILVIEGYHFVGVIFPQLACLKCNRLIHDLKNLANLQLRLETR